MSNDGGSNAHVEHNDEKYFLLQHPHQEVPINSDYDWMALAECESGEQITVTWKQLPGFNGDDDSDACDWDNFEVIA